MHPLGAGVFSLSGEFQDVSPLAEFSTHPNTLSSRTVKGGVSWQVLDSKSSVQEEISSFLQTVTNTGTNYRCVPSYFYELTMRPKTVTVILQWSTDTTSVGFDSNARTSQMAEQHSSLSKLYPVQCEDLGKKSDALTADVETDFQKWKEQAEAVQTSLDNLLRAMANHSGTPLYGWTQKRSRVWTATREGLESYMKSADRNDKSKALTKGNAVAVMKNQIHIIVSGDPGSDGITFGVDLYRSISYGLTKDAKNLLNSDSASGGAKEFISRYGHSFVESYTETGKLSAIWSLELNPHTNARDVEIFRMLIQQYFLAARSISEVCEFFADGGIRSRVKPGLQLDIKTSIFGFCDPASTTPRTLHAIEPWRAKYYLTTDALQRNRVRTSYRLRPFAGLQVRFKEGEEKQKAAFIALIPIAPDQPVVLSLQDILRQLFILNAYARVPAAKVDPKVLAIYWKTFNFREGTSMAKDDGKIIPNAATALSQLGCNLQEAIQAAEAAMREQSAGVLLD